MKNVLLSGPTYSGKTSLATRLKDQLGYEILAARSVIRELAGDDLRERDELQNFGEQLETQNPGKWLASAFEAAIICTKSPVAVDAVRTGAQCLELTQIAQFQVVHVHVTASMDVRRDRFVSRRDEVDAGASFDEVANHPIEQIAFELEDAADLVVDTTERSIEEAFDVMHEWLLATG